MLVLVWLTATAATFDWGSECSSGADHFQDAIGYRQIESIGTIPDTKEDVRIDLSSDADVDVQLIDPETGITLVGWPDGYLSGPTEDCMNYESMEICYSGYNGVDGELGNEWIEVRGMTRRPLEMSAYGYQSGDADVNYSWVASNICNEWGRGTFDKSLSLDADSEIGVIPQGKANVYIQLDADEDLDIRLYDGDTAIVEWPDGLLSGPELQTVDYEGLEIEWSGYNGTPKGLGHEYIRITGTLDRDLTMSAFAYQAGTADVFYEWGIGAGDACGSRGLPVCEGDLMCKNGDHGQIEVDKPGQCHQMDWCESDASAADDCKNLHHIMVVGDWGCTDFTCEWRPLGFQPVQ